MKKKESTPQERRAVSQDFTALRAWGAEEDAAVLKRAWLASKTAGDEPLTHAIHPYPGRLHWAVARELIRTYGKPGDVLLDPFVGGGTTMVEGMLAGMRGYGVDLNPLSTAVIRTKTRLTSKTERDEFLACVERVADQSEERVRGRQRAQIPLGKADAAWYSPHVLFEFSGLLEEIRAKGGDWVEPMEILFSALTTKFSLQVSETVVAKAEKRVRKGLVTEFFRRRAGELSRHWATLGQELRTQKTRPPFPHVVKGDARTLARALAWPNETRADLVVTSPPYAGTYDYVDHHRRRIAWLGHRSKVFAELEMGSRRTMQNESLGRWQEELEAFFRSVRGVSNKRIPIAVVMGDGKVGREETSAVKEVKRAAEQAGLNMVAAATIKRETIRGRKKKTEAIILLR